MSDWKSNRLRVLRAEHRLSQDELADRLDISQAQYSKLERGFVEPTAEQRRVLARAFKVRVSSLTAEFTKAKAS